MYDTSYFFPYRVYELLSRGQVVYIGSTGNLPGRLDDHKREGKVFDDHRSVSFHSSEEDARDSEHTHLLSFVMGNGKLPHYNKTMHG